MKSTLRQCWRCETAYSIWRVVPIGAALFFRLRYMSAEMPSRRCPVSAPVGRCVASWERGRVRIAPWQVERGFGPIFGAPKSGQEKGIGAFRANAYSQQPAVRAAARVCGFWKLTLFSRFPERFDAKFEKSRRKAPCHNGLRRRFDRKSVRFIPL